MIKRHGSLLARRYLSRKLPPDEVTERVAHALNATAEVIQRNIDRLKQDIQLLEQERASVLEDRETLLALGAESYVVDSREP